MRDAPGGREASTGGTLPGSTLPGSALPGSALSGSALSGRTLSGSTEVVVPAPPIEVVPEDVHASWSPAPAPDGSAVAFVSDRSGRPEVWVRLLDVPNPMVIPGPWPVVSAVTWSPDGGLLVVTVPAADGSRAEVHALPQEGGAAYPLVDDAGRSAHWSPGLRGPWSADGRLMLTDAGAESVAMLLEPHSARREVLDTGPTLVLLDVSDDARRVLLRLGPRSARHTVLLDRETGRRVPLDERLGPGTTDTGCLSPDGTTAYLLTNRGREHTALVAVSVLSVPDDRVRDARVPDERERAGDEPGPIRVVAERADDLELARLDRAAAYAVLGWNVHAGCSSLEALDLRTGQCTPLDPPRDVVREVVLLPTALPPGHLPADLAPRAGVDPRHHAVITAESWTDSRGVWAITLDHAVPEPLSGDGRLLFASPGARGGRAPVGHLIRPELRTFASSDGLRVSGWWYPARSGEGGAAVLHLHGGPESQERPTYSSLFQTLAADGVSVWALNVRGSSGFGRSFTGADDREGRWGAIDDVGCAARHLVATGAAEPGRVAVMGRSYGGYLTLAALVHFPDLFAAAVSVCGMSSLLTFFADTEPSIAAAAVSKYGSPETDADLLRALSPMTHIDRLRAPVLVVHGGLDTNVPVGEARQLVDALRAREVPHRFLLYEGEGHEIAATTNRVHFVREVVEWLGHHLRG